MRAWANLYPWDVDGDPAAPDRIAGLGLTGCLAARSPAPGLPRRQVSRAARSPARRP
jgi:hypothetical protein